MGGGSGCPQTPKICSPHPAPAGWGGTPKKKTKQLPQKKKTKRCSHFGWGCKRKSTGGGWTQFWPLGTPPATTPPPPWLEKKKHQVWVWGGPTNKKGKGTTQPPKRQQKIPPRGGKKKNLWGGGKGGKTIKQKKPKKLWEVSLVWGRGIFFFGSRLCHHRGGSFPKVVTKKKKRKGGGGKQHAQPTGKNPIKIVNMPTPATRGTVVWVWGQKNTLERVQPQPSNPASFPKKEMVGFGNKKRGQTNRVGVVFYLNRNTGPGHTPTTFFVGRLVMGKEMGWVGGGEDKRGVKKEQTTIFSQKKKLQPQTRNKWGVQKPPKIK